MFHYLHTFAIIFFISQHICCHLMNVNVFLYRVILFENLPLSKVIADQSQLSQDNTDQSEPLFKVIAAEGEQKASRALREASDVIAKSSSALQLRYLQVKMKIVVRNINIISCSLNNRQYDIPLFLPKLFYDENTLLSETLKLPFFQY